MIGTETYMMNVMVTLVAILAFAGCISNKRIHFDLRVTMMATW